MCKFTCKRPLSSIAFNANWIAGQSNELEILYVRKIYILLINETHLNENDKFRFTNYIIYRNDRRMVPMGGTAICVKNGIGHRVASIPNLHFIEITGIYLPIDNNKEILIGSVYKSPSKLVLLLMIWTSTQNFQINIFWLVIYILSICLGADVLRILLHIYCRMHNMKFPRQTEPPFYRSTRVGANRHILDIVISKNVNISPHHRGSPGDVSEYPAT